MTTIETLQKDEVVGVHYAKYLVECVSDLFQVETPNVTFKEEDAQWAGDYSCWGISVYGKVTIQIVLHEMAHHIHATRLGYIPARGHAVGFHRICFEIRDAVAKELGMDVVGINGYEHTEGFAKALNEWAFRNQQHVA